MLYKNKNYDTYGRKLKEVLKNDKNINSNEGYKQNMSLRCSKKKKKCLTFYSISLTNKCFIFTDLNGKFHRDLSLCETTKIWCHGTSTN